MTRVALKSSALAALFVVGTLLAYAIDTRFDISLLLPTIAQPVIPGQTATLPASHLETFTIQVTPQVGHVRYGSIRISIKSPGSDNEESVSASTTISGTDSGYRCEVNLKPDGVITLKPGSNQIILDFTDTWNQPHRQTFTVVLHS